MINLYKVNCLLIILFLNLSTNASAGPKYRDYPVSNLYNGPAAKLVLDNDLAKNFRTSFNDALKNKPVLAGEYIITGWGCGSSGCYNTAIINKRTGQVVQKVFEAYSASSGEDEVRVGEELESPQLNSRLFVTEETVEGKSGKYLHFTNYYILNNSKLKRIKRIQSME